MDDRVYEEAFEPEPFRPVAPDEIARGIGVAQIEQAVAEAASASVSEEYRRKRQRRAAVNRLVDFVRIEHLGFRALDDRTSVEELTVDAIIRAVELYVEGRPKAARETGFSLALDTLERMRVTGEANGSAANV